MINIDNLKIFLSSVDKSFPVPLSDKQELSKLAEKFMEKATLCYVEQEDEIVALVAGYTENVTDNMGYISVVATLAEARGKGYATKLVKDFTDIAAGKGLSSVHLYTSRSNLSAIKMYEKIGFEEWVPDDEPRPDDLHLLFKIKEG